MKKIAIIASLAMLFAGQTFAQTKKVNTMELTTDVNHYTFKLSDKVTKEKVSYHNKFGILIAADLYLPKNFDSTKKYPAIIVGPPYGGVKEQTAGIYAQNMAERGFAVLAFDPSYKGFSGGEPRNTSSPDIFVEDFSAGVDYMGTRNFIDRNKIGAIGLCGSGGFSLAAAAVDPRIKAVATVSMYDIARAEANGWKDGMTPEQRKEKLNFIAQNRWDNFEKAPELKARPNPADVPNIKDPIAREFAEYYSTTRGYHPNASLGHTLASSTSWMNFPLVTHIKEISSRPILLIMGETAHSRYFSEDIYQMAAEPKELFIVPKAGHVDLYDKVDVIPFD
ncbi:MAG: alpha/beta hydrolase, partial [Chitinophagaceae bacterium]